MIFVQERVEPADFERKVRTPGQAFLGINHTPSNKEYKPHRYWKDIDLHAAYEGICAYSAHWIPPRGTVDHYIPKSVNPDLAYEWSNYRLCTERMNNNKDNKLDVMDPFSIQSGWFVIDFDTFFVEPEPNLPEYVKTAVSDTITRLRLNDDDDLIQDRANTVVLYSNGDVPFDFLLRRYPFIARELERQDLRERIKMRPKNLTI
jgi:hypothetical protein